MASLGRVTSLLEAFSPSSSPAAEDQRFALDQVKLLVEYHREDIRSTIAGEQGAMAEKLFRLLRNWTAASPDFQQRLNDEEWIELLFLHEDQCIITISETSRFLLQFLCNYITNNKYAQARVWKLAFPQQIKEAAENVKSSQSHSHILLVWLYNMVVNDESRLKELCVTGEGKEILKIVMSFLTSSDEACFEWSVRLCRVMIEKTEFQNLFAIFQPSALPEEYFLLSEEQIAILRVLEEQGNAQNGVGRLEMFRDSSFCHFLVSRLMQSYAALEQEKTENQKDIELIIQSLYIILELFGEISSEIGATYPTLRTSLQDANLVPFSIRVLEMLCQEGRVPESLKSLKVLLIRILANLAYKHFDTQEQIRELHGLELILNQCRIDPANEFIKEWSVLAIRNLCENNEKNQKFIAELRAQEVVDLPMEMEAAGVTAEIVDGKVALKTPQSRK